HPSSYALVTKYVDDVWPCHCDLESHHVKFLEHLIAQFSFKRSTWRVRKGMLWLLPRYSGRIPDSARITQALLYWKTSESWK
ncbi:hypothetical protein IGA90_30070, partial [Pseudomonas aeruginosa]|uniref:hypothetical protein n=1 Tax=Pseudomonas aeruginosa TaxID=287 RepID=UPI00130C0C5B